MIILSEKSKLQNYDLQKKKLYINMRAHGKGRNKILIVGCSKYRIMMILKKYFSTFLYTFCNGVMTLIIENY